MESELFLLMLSEGRDDQHVKLWLSELKQVAYDLEDIVDEFVYRTTQTEAHEHGDLKRKFQVLDTALSPLHDECIENKMLEEIRNIRSRVDSISNYRKNLSLRVDDGQIREKARVMRASSSLASEMGDLWKGRREE